MQTRVQVASIAFAVLVLAGVFELVRRRHLRERSALVWMGAAIVLLTLAIWRDLLATVARAVGIYSPPNAFFVIAFGSVLLLLLYFTVALSKLGDQSRVLAQRLALLEERLRAVEEPTEDESEEQDAPSERVAAS